MSGRSHTYRSLKHATVPPPSSVEQLEEFIQERLTAPVILEPDLPQDLLDRTWLGFVADQFEVAGEASGCMRPDDGWDLCMPVYEAFFYHDAEDWHEMATNCDSWYATARARFLDLFLGPLLLAPFVTAAERPKHFPLAADLTAADLQRRSRKNVSIFSFGLDSSVLGEFTRSVEADHQVFPLLVGASGLRVFVECICEVGYVDGDPTSIIAVEWTSSAVHCYPVASSEVRRAGAASNLIYDDSLQGEAKAMRGAPPG